MKKTNWLPLLAVALLWVSCKPKETTTPPTGDDSTMVYVRKNAHSPAAQADIEAMRAGVKAMKALDCTDPRSWYYQGAIHHLPDTIANQPNRLCASYENNGDYLPGFATCPHMRPGYTQFHFLTWHRLYIWYWERLVRKYSGKADFALPYWDYNRDDQRTMPELFREPASLETNPIYEPGRSRYLLAGNAIAASDSDGIVMNVNGNVTLVCNQSMAGALDTVRLWEANDIHLFSVELEDGTHNTIHDYVGGAVNKEDVAEAIPNRIYQMDTLTLQGLMADVPSAGFDPIFFLHHSNIDRLWYTWEADFPAKSLTKAEFEALAGPWPYIFFDENGKKIEYTSLGQVYDSIRAIDYTYDYMAKRQGQLKQAPPVPLVKGASAVAVTPRRALKANDMVEVKLPQGGLPSKKAHISLEVEVTFVGQPRSHLAVMLRGGDQDAPAKEALCEKYLVGVGGFFGASHSHHADSASHHAMHEGDGRSRKIFRFDLTEELADLAAFDDSKVFVHLHMLRMDPASAFRLERVEIFTHAAQ